MAKDPSRRRERTIRGMELANHLADLLSAARVGLDAGDAALALDPGGARVFTIIERGAAELGPQLVEALEQVVTGLGVPVVLLLRRADGRPVAVDHDAWARLSGSLVDGLVVGDRSSWSLREERELDEALVRC